MGRLASLTREEQAKLGRASAPESNLDPEWLKISEFGGYFGYAGIVAIMKDEIDMEHIDVLIEGQRYIHARNMLDIAEATLASAAAAQAGKKAGSVFQKLTRNFINRMKVKE